jgi:hypothetical protein
LANIDFILCLYTAFQRAKRLKLSRTEINKKTAPLKGSGSKNQ